MVGITRKIGKVYRYVGSYRFLDGAHVKVLSWHDWGHGLTERGYRVEIVDNYRDGEWVGEILDNVSANSLTSV